MFELVSQGLYHCAVAKAEDKGLLRVAPHLCIDAVDVFAATVSAFAFTVSIDGKREYFLAGDTEHEFHFFFLA